MKKNLLLILLVFPFLAFAAKNTFTIQGKIGQLDTPAKVYLSYRLGNSTVTDSASLKKGNFTLKGMVENPVMATLILNTEGTGLRARNVKTLPFYVEKGKIRIDSDEKLENPFVKGGRANTDNEKLKTTKKEVTNRMKELNNEATAWTPEQRSDKVVRESFDKRYKELYEKGRSISKDFVKTNPGSPICIDVIRNIGGAFPEYTELWPLFEVLSAEIKATPSGKEYAAKLEKIRPLATGAIAPDFTQNTPDGKPLKVSDFRGKYLLIDFWAAWCGPCRAENPFVVKAYEKYHQKGFEILAVSLDKTDAREAWLKAIEKDNLTWPQVSDLKFWENAAARLYDVQGIPMNYLLDPDGKIIAKSLRGKRLEEKLAELLK